MERKVRFNEPKSNHVLHAESQPALNESGNQATRVESREVVSAMAGVKRARTVGKSVQWLANASDEPSLAAIVRSKSSLAAESRPLLK